MEEANRCGDNAAKMKDILGSILLICKVFYSLNSQVSNVVHHLYFHVMINYNV